MTIFQAKDESFHNYEFCFSNNEEMNRIALELEELKDRGLVKNIGATLAINVAGEKGSTWACVRDNVMESLMHRLKFDGEIEVLED